MSHEVIAFFLERVEQDLRLQGQVRAALDSSQDPAAVAVTVAARHGYEFTSREFSQAVEAARRVNL